MDSKLSALCHTIGYVSLDDIDNFVSYLTAKQFSACILVRKFNAFMQKSLGFLLLACDSKELQIQSEYGNGRYELAPYS